MWIQHPGCMRRQPSHATLGKWENRSLIYRCGFLSPMRLCNIAKELFEAQCPFPRSSLAYRFAACTDCQSVLCDERLSRQAVQSKPPVVLAKFEKGGGLFPTKSSVRPPPPPCAPSCRMQIFSSRIRARYQPRYVTEAFAHAAV